MVKTENAQFLAKGKANFPVNKFYEFWNQKTDFAIYIQSLVEYIIELEKKRSITGVSLEQTLATLYMVAVCGFYSEEEPFLAEVSEVRHKFETHRNSHRSLNKALDEVVNVALNLHTQPEEVMELVVRHSTTFPEPVRKFADIKYKTYFGEEHCVTHYSDLFVKLGLGSIYLSQNPRFSILDCGEFSVAYRFIHKFLHTSSVMSSSVLEAFIKRIQQIVNQVRLGNSRQAEGCLLSVLHLLEQLVTRYPIIESSEVMNLITEVDVVRRWPIPYGSTAHRFLKVLVEEMKLKGNCLRNKIRDEYPMVDAFFPLSKEEATEKSEFMKAHAFLFLDSQDSLETGLFHKILALNQNKKEEFFQNTLQNVDSLEGLDRLALQAHILRVSMILFVLKPYNNLLLTDVSFVAGLSPEQVYMLYNRMLEILNTLAGVETEKAEKLQQEYFFDFMVEISKLPSDEYNQLTRVIFKHLCDYNCYTPQIPRQDLAWIDLGSGSDFSYDLNQALGPQERNMDPLLRLLLRNINENSPFYASPLKLLVSGPDSIFQKFLRSYYKIVKTHPSLIRDADLRLYLVPTYSLRNSLIEYLASIDQWYMRHVYVPFAHRPWVPRMDSSVDIKKRKKDPFAREFVRKSIASSDSEAITPNFLPITESETLLQDYLLGASQVLPVTVYQIKAWTTKPLSEEPDTVIPFCLYLEMGIKAKAAQLQQEHESFQGKSYQEILESKSFSYIPQQVCMKTIQMDPFGVEYSFSETATKLIHSLCISNVPRETDTTTPSIPSSEWLELSYIEPEAAVQQQAYFKKIHKTRENLANINVAISSLYSSLHVSQTRISFEQNAKEHIVVDGVLQGPFNTIEIQPLTLDDGSLVSLPVMLFLEPEL